jgi:acyl transferase domain-containing protein
MQRRSSLPSKGKAMTQKKLDDEAYATAIAIVGMAGRFPGAQTVEEFWDNIAGGRKAIRFFSDEELLEAGVSPADLKQPNYVRAGTVLPEIEKFDAAFFGYTPREAEIIDPQQRVFLEVAWEALETAGYNPETYEGMIGVFAGSAISTYMLNNLFPRPDVIDLVGPLQTSLGNDKDSLATRVSYKLNLRGPSIAVQTYCSSSLVSVHLGCQSLLNYECDLVLAGGVAIAVPQVSGYLYQEGGLLPPDGESRPFDAEAKGTLKGNGAGVVVLKRLSEAIEDGDQIYAVIRGSAVNNDGRFRVSYAAPGLEGQSEVIAEALANAEVEAESIGYIEAHGTATALGDSIELAALHKAFALSTEKKRFCAIGTVKANIGHLDRASGVTGLIKTALALQHRQLPATLNFTRPNPDINLSNSPFYINTELASWPQRGATPRRAGVSSFGMGGTNAHVILEEAAEREAGSASRPQQLLLLSAKSETALQRMSANLARHLRQHPELDLADVAYTLQVGRSIFPYRRMLVCADRDEAIALLEQPAPPETILQDAFKDRRAAFLLGAGGGQCVELLSELAPREPFLREQLERSLNLLKRRTGLDLTTLRQGKLSPQQLGQPIYTAAASFIAEYALAQLLMHWGIEPQALAGEGIGELVAATLAGIYSLEDALLVVTRSAQWRQEAQSGDQDEALSARLSALVSEIRLHAPEISIVAGSTGTWLLPEQATSPSYWAERLSASTRLGQADETLLQEKQRIVVELGRESASSLANSSDETRSLVCAFAPDTNAFQAATRAICAVLGKLWLSGVPLDWSAFYEDERRLRVALPTYPFERQRYWIDPPKGYAQRNASLLSEHAREESVALPTAPRAMFSAAEDGSGPWVLFVDPASLDADLASTLKEAMARGAIHQVASEDDFQQRMQQWMQTNGEAEGGAAQSRELNRANLSTAYVAPENPLEEHIIEIWEELLGLSGIGIRDNFFELGGHSLIGTRLISRLRQSFQVDIPLAILFQASTVEELALIVGELLLKDIEQEASLASLQ